MKRLLLAYDGSPGAEAAMNDLPLAGLPADLEARVLAVADVWLPPENLAATATVAAQKAHEQARGAVTVAREIAEDAADQLRAKFPNWTVSAKGCGDSPAWAILNESARWPADLVVVGSHGRSMLERIFLGSVSQKVLAEARCSVRIARGSKATPDALRCLVAVDGSADSEAAVRGIAARKWPASAQFRVVTVVDPRLESVVVWPGVYAEQWVQQRAEETREWISRVTVHHVEILRAAGLSAEMDVFDGDPAKVLLREAEAWKATTLFLGARGLHHGDRHFLGTTASAVATRAHCSVELVRPA